MRSSMSTEKNLSKVTEAPALRLSTALSKDNMESFSVISDRDIIAARPERERLPVDKPQTFFVEPEHSAAGVVEDVATIFLTNRECPFRCLMCDLWKGTTEESVPVGAIPMQIDYALSRLGPARHLKLYNSGNFFDSQAIPIEDHQAIASRCSPFQSVIVENHPKLCGPRCLNFRDLLSDRDIEFEIAVGLETIHPDVLPRLNKQMTAADFASAARFLHSEGIRTRAFILLKPPFMSEQEGIEWAIKSIQFAFECGVSCCSVIPTRGGNGIMETLTAVGLFEPPSLHALEQVLERGLQLQAGRVFVDLWDAERTTLNDPDKQLQVARMKRMNHSQRVE